MYRYQENDHLGYGDGTAPDVQTIRLLQQLWTGIRGDVREFRSETELRSGTYSGFGFTWENGEFWSFKGYYRQMGWMLPLLIVIPPVLVYGLVWGISTVFRWVWRGFRHA